MARILLFLLLAISLPILILSIWIAQIPDPKIAKSCFVTSMHKVNLCPGSDSYVKLSNIAAVTREVILVSEDASFYSHSGFDWFELKQSFRKNLEKFSFSRGGSTITQQLAKNLFLEGHKTLGRKAKEAILSIELERMFTKDQIFERYLNVVQFGKNIFGIKAAAAHYFSKHPSELNILESAFLAYLLPNPEVYSRVYYKAKLTQFSEGRLRDLVRRMVRFRKLSQEQAEQARAMISFFPWKGLDAQALEYQLSGQSCAGQICEDGAEDDQIPQAEDADWIEVPDEEPSDWDESMGEGQEVNESQ